MTTLANVIAGTGAITDINDNFIATSPAGIYGRRANATAGLVWGYYGGIAFNSTISNSTVSLTASSTNYIVAAKSNGAVSVSTATTNWNNTSNYYRLYLVVTGAASVNSYVDHRDFTGSGSGGGGGAVNFIDLGDVPSSYVGAENQFVKVKATADGLEFVAGGSGGEAIDITYDPTASGLSATNVQDAIDELAAGGGAGERNTVTALSIASGVVNINCALGDYFTLALTANVTSITFSNLPGTGKGRSLMLRITQDTTPRTVSWPASFRWEGSAPVVSTGSGAIDVLAITTFDNGGKWDATISKGRA